MGSRGLVIGQNSHWAWHAATTVLLLPPVARSVNLPSVSSLRPRTGALDPLLPWRFEKAVVQRVSSPVKRTVQK